MANIAWNGDELQTITNNINECLKLLQVQQAHLEKLRHKHRTTGTAKPGASTPNGSKGILQKSGRALTCSPLRSTVCSRRAPATRRQETICSTLC